jgi:ATP-dependent Lon protease
MFEDYIPLLPLRDMVAFPNMVLPLLVGRPYSLRTMSNVKVDDEIFLLGQKKVSKFTKDTDEIYRHELYDIGCLATVSQKLDLPDGTIKILVSVQMRGRFKDLYMSRDGFFADVQRLPEKSMLGIDEDTVRETLVSEFEQYTKVASDVPNNALQDIKNKTDVGAICDYLANLLPGDIHKQQTVLSAVDYEDRAAALMSWLTTEKDLLLTERRVQSRVKTQMERTQREYYLNEQMKAIQKELDEGAGTSGEMNTLEGRIKDTQLSDEARKKAESEFKKLKMMSPMSAEAGVVRNYLDWLLNVPWKVTSDTSDDLKKAMNTLDADHYGLEKVKERIVEHLAVQNRVGTVQGSVLCLVGPPGVGKTSLGRSIAKATGRTYVRMALGGVKDESEIRGHRRTYIGAMPGKIIQGLHKAKVTNPLFLLDEIDKLGADWRGDPSAALLEVLDPEQSGTFVDHYLEVEYDLSNVMFVTTANSLDMPDPLKDRMEMIHLSGYTEIEKFEISKRHLIPKQTKVNGLKNSEFSITDAAVWELVRSYTREAGVRDLERHVAKLARKAVYRLETEGLDKFAVTIKNIYDVLGVPRYKRDKKETNNLVGVTTGLAWTRVGGEILYIEAVKLPGKGQIKATGKLSDVMQESVQASISYVRSRAVDFGVHPDIFGKIDIHVHVPEGATPKDGPSAGIAMCASITSILTGIPVHAHVAMTGEVSLRGRVLPIGGLKEKLLAALREGCTKVLIPQENAMDIVELPDNIKDGLEIVPVKTVEEVLKHALTKPLKPLAADSVDLPPFDTSDHAFMLP